ncbi:pdz/dhr/glgf [Purpureocillium lavendulum]|uniref:Pdz/dhr/glgf n=1 Tax=Purpureocillium lavendulum TaxID=1247861 RepID=A0AB34G862_9HYPO|nr:pdz/dhr/glgf [Purpureocillium lavendulum]
MATTVILGSGIIGLSTAYYLSRQQPGSSIHLVDPSPRLFASASGYAGGFVARDWFDPRLAALGALSYQEHATLASEHGGAERWGYTRSVTLSYGSRGEAKMAGHDGEGEGDWLRDGTSRAGDAGEKESRKGDAPPWLRLNDGDKVNVMDVGEGTAVVDPLKLCEFLLEHVKATGVHVHHPAMVLSVGTDVRDELASVTIGYTNSSAETETPATRLLLCAGAWTPQVLASLFPLAGSPVRITSLAGHSLVVRTPGFRAGDGSHSLFCTLSDQGLSPEIFARADGVIYLSGVNSPRTPLPRLATAAQPEEAAMEKLKDVARRLVSVPAGHRQQELEVVRAGLCFRPVTDRGAPYITRLRDEQLGVKTRVGQEGGVFVAAGHGPWGISLSLGTGKVMAEMMADRETSADISNLGI